MGPHTLYLVKLTLSWLGALALLASAPPLAISPRLGHLGSFRTCAPVPSRAS